MPSLNCTCPPSLFLFPPQMWFILTASLVPPKSRCLNFICQFCSSPLEYPLQTQLCPQIQLMSRFAQLIFSWPNMASVLCIAHSTLTTSGADLHTAWILSSLSNSYFLVPFKWCMLLFRQWVHSHTRFRIPCYCLPKKLVKFREKQNKQKERDEETWRWWPCLLP